MALPLIYHVFPINTHSYTSYPVDKIKNIPEMMNFDKRNQPSISPSQPKDLIILRSLK